MLIVLALAIATLTRLGGLPGTDREPFAVIELFTSEGCSSCPPADAVLAEFASWADPSAARVFPLAFHVDYWDGLGWKDPYASAEATRRQREYAAVFSGAGVYTPQMIVNGRDQFVGSDKARAREAVRSALAAAPGAQIRVATTRDNESLGVSVDVQDLAERAGLVVNIALVQRGLSSRVKAGENSGRRLTHENVVRSFASPALAPAGTSTTARLDVPAGAITGDLSVIVYVQDGKSRRVLGAGRAALPAAPPPGP